jgi:hypothetical protein
MMKTEAKYIYKNKRGRYDIIIEVGHQTLKQLLQTKLKIRWDICDAVDYQDAINAADTITNTANVKEKKHVHTVPANMR